MCVCITPIDLLRSTTVAPVHIVRLQITLADTVLHPRAIFQVITWGGSIWCVSSSLSVAHRVVWPVHILTHRWGI